MGSGGWMKPRKSSPRTIASSLLRRPAELLWPGLSEPGSLRGGSAESLQHTLLRLFRRHAAGAVAVFAHLALVWLMVERLRGGLLVRALFDSRPAPALH